MAANESLISPEICKNFEKQGKVAIAALLKISRSNDEVWVDIESAQSTRKLLYELFELGIAESIKSPQILRLLENEAESRPDIVQESISILSIIDSETRVESKERHQRLITLIKDLKPVLPDSLLKEQLDAETLEELRLVTAQQFNQKCIKVKTKMYYKQIKFNLLREEMEGYSKLVTEVSQQPSAALPSAAILQNVMSLIGRFNLDPNRVLEVVLQVFESRLDLADDLYIPFLRSYTPEYDTLVQMVGFRLHSYKATADSKDDGSRRAPPPVGKNTFDVIALLMKSDLVTLDSLYPHLTPSDAKIRETYKTELSDARMSVKRTKAVHTGDSQNKEGQVAEDQTREAQPLETTRNRQDALITNQKLGLIEALLRHGCWHLARQIMDRLPQYHATSFPGIADVMCSLISRVIEPFYAKHHGLPKQLYKPMVDSVTENACPIEAVASWNDLILSAFPMLRYLGCHISCDTKLMIRVVRIIRSCFTLRMSKSFPGSQDDSDLVYRHCLAVLDEVILPSLCLASNNCCMAEQVWTVIQLLPYEHRYQLYGQWKSQTYYTQPELIAARLDTLKKAKYIFSRLTKENVKQQGRQIGKLSHANPAVFFEYMFTQVQVYDNLIAPIVDSLKFLSSLSFDVLAYCLMAALAAPDKERMKVDDTNLSTWLKSLSNFTGLVLKKYQVEFGGVLQYICNQLKAEKSYDLLILREMLTKMGGIEVTEEITDQQLEAMCGGDLLKLEGGNFQQQRNVKKPSQRLKETLLKFNLATPLCLLMAQQRDSIIYRQPNMDSQEHIKLVGKIYDQCQDTLVQFITFLTNQLTPEELTTKLPSLDTMIAECHVPFDAAFYVYRPIINQAINTSFEALRREDRLSKERDGKPVAVDKSRRYAEAFSSTLNPVSEKIRELYPEKMWADISPLVYTTFWTLKAYDLHVPKSAYEKEVGLVQQKIKQMEIEAGREMRDSKKKKEVERCNQMIARFREEEKRQSEHCSRVLAKLEQDKDKWFKSADTQKQVERFIQHCIFPRLMLTTVDAFYTARMIHVMHQLKTPNFGTLILLDRIFNDITYLITCCTENEAHRYGRFLCSVLSISERWRQTEENYKKECSGHPGFITTFRSSSHGANYAELSYEDYRHVCHKWQFRMTKAVLVCFDSGTYTQNRNALIVLTKVLPHFPMIVGIGQALERRVDRIHKDEKEKRPDLYALAMGYAGMLKTRRPTWIPESQYHFIDPKKLKKRQEMKAKATTAAKPEVPVVKIDSGDTPERPAVERTHKPSDVARPAPEKRSAVSSTSSTSNKTPSKERQEAEAFLKSAKTESEPEPKRVKIEPRTEAARKSEPGGKSSSKSGVSSSPKPSNAVTNLVVKTEKSRTVKVKVEDVKLKVEKRSSSKEKTSTAKSVETSPAHRVAEDKRRKVESGEGSSSRSSKSASAPSKAASTADTSRDRSTEKADSRKRMSDAVSPRNAETKKTRRSDSRDDHMKNGASNDEDRRTTKRPKEDSREKKGEKQRSRKSDVL